jgi:hypothetical protein
MKLKAKLLLMTSALFFTSHAQLDDGAYHFTDGQYHEVELSVCEGGEMICDFTFLHDENVITTGSQGEWFRVNANGADENYEGPWGWYQIQTDDEYFEIEVLSSDRIKVLRGEDTELFLYLRK